MDPRSAESEDEQFAEFFDDRRLFRSATRVPRLRLPRHPVDRGDWVGAVSLVLVSLIAAGAMRLTSPGLQDELLESPVFPWTWLLGPVLCGMASVARPFASRPLWWALCLVGPWLVVAAMEGLVLFDPWRGASFWGWNAMVLVFQALLCWAAGGVAALVAVRRSAVSAIRSDVR